jgi:hypothetical protein
MVAGRVVTWALIVLGSAEVFWVLYLAFTQERVVRIFHARLATLGLGGFAAVLAAGAALAIARRGAWAPALSVGAATLLAFLSAFGRLTPDLNTSGLLGAGARPILVALPGIVAACYASVVLLREREPGRPAGGPARSHPLAPALRVAVAVLALTAAVVVVRIVVHVLSWDSTALSTQSRAIIVLLDTGETIGLLGAGLASLTGHVRATLVLATIAISLLLADAYGNVVMAASGQAFAAAVFYLVVGEIPSIIVCGLAVLASQRMWLESTAAERLPA